MLGISLVTSSFAKGKHLVITIQNKDKEDSLKYLYNNYNIDLLFDSTGNRETNNKEVFGFSSKRFCEFFLPKQTALIGEVFDITIENINFLSIPTIVNEELHQISKERD
jgi:hypothetical protein